MPVAYADHTSNTIETVLGSGAPGCETTTNGCYLPNTVTVNVGQSVIMSNTDTAAHTFTSGTPDDGPSGVFDTGLLKAGNSFEFIPNISGQIDYFCMVHPWMTGVIVVTGDSNPTSNPIPINPPTQNNNLLEIENQQLRDEIRDLKLENRDLKIINTELQNEIDELKNQIVLMTKEFVDSLTQLNEWFRSQLG